MGASSSTTANSQFLDNTLDRGGISAAQMMIIAIALILNIVDGYDVTAMAFTAHSIGEALSISPAHLGILFSVALAGMMVGAMFIAPFSDMIGRRKMLLISVTFIGISVIVTAYSTALWQMILLRGITGLGVGSMLASLTAISSEYTPSKYRSLAVVTITAGYPLGATLGGFIAAPLIPVYGWQSVFLVGGTATLFMVPVIYFLVPESLQFLVTKRPPNALQTLNAALTRMNKPTLNQLPELAQEAKIEKANVLSLLTESRRLTTITLWSTFFFCFICLYFLMSWIPKLVVNSGLSESEGVYAAVALNGGGVIGIIVLGWVSSRVSLSKLISTFLSLAALFMMVFASASASVNLLLILFVIGFFLQGGFTGLYAVAAKIYPTEIRTTGVGWAIGLGRSGAVVGPYVGGLLIAGGYSMETNFFLFALPLLIAGVLSFRLAVK